MCAVPSDGQHDRLTPALIGHETSLLVYLMKTHNELEYRMLFEHVEDVVGDDLTPIIALSRNYQITKLQFYPNDAYFVNHFANTFVFTQLKNKRVVVKDENFASFNVVHKDGYTLDTIYELTDQDDNMFEWQKRLRQISQVNRVRRNYLLLRDWSKKRPWKQIYQLINTSSSPEIRKAIRDFHRRIDTLKDLERGEKPNPSSAANVWSSIIPVHPIASHDDEEPRPFRPKYFQNGCVICCNSFDAHQLPVVTKRSSRNPEDRTPLIVTLQVSF